MSVLQRVEKSLAAGSGLSSSAAVEAVLLLSSMVKQQCYLSDVVAAIRLLSLVFLDAGDNFLRAAIVEALKKVGQFDFPQSAAALLAPIVRVLDSNDPVARGLALQALGHLCTLIRHQDDVHFRVLERLGSDNVLERESALFCIGRLAALSEPFAAAVLRSAPALLRDEASGEQFKLGLVRVLGKLKHSDAISSSARGLGIAFMQSHPREDFVVGCLLALSQTAELHAEEHVSLLWQNFLSDPRPRVRLACVRGLFSLAHRAPHHGDHRPAFILALLSQHSPPIQAALAAVLTVLSRHWHAGATLMLLDTRPLEVLLSSPHARVRLWALRALAGAANFFPASAHQLFSHVSLSVGVDDQVVRSPLLSACLSLCSRAVERHSSDLRLKTVFLLVKAAKQPHREDAAALLHALSVAVSGVPPSEALEKELVGLAHQYGAAPACFTSVMIAMVRVSRAVNARGVCSGDVAAKFGPLLQQSEALCDTAPAWLWAWYCVAREAAVAGLHSVSSRMFFYITQFPESDRFRSWLLFLADASRAEMHSQARNLIEAAGALRRASVAIAAAGPPAMEQSMNQTAVQTFSRSSAMTFQKRYCKWRLGAVEAALSRSDLWLALAHEADAMAQSFPDMPAGTVSFLKDCAACCGVIGGVPTKSEPSANSSLVSRLRAASSKADAEEVLSALRVASSMLPRYLFKSEPSIGVEIAVAKSKVPVDMSEISILNASDTGHVVTIDGIIRQGSRVFSAVELEVSVVWSAEKPSVAARLLCCDRTVGNVLSLQHYKSRVTGGNFSTLTVLTFPGQPKHQHLISVRIALIEAETEARFNNVALITLPYTVLST